MTRFVALKDPTLRGKSFREEVEIGATILGSASSFSKISLDYCMRPHQNIAKLKRKPQLNPISRAGAIVVLDDTLNMLQTIQTGIGEYIYSSWRKPFRYKTPTQRFVMNEEDQAQYKEEIYEMILTDRQKVQKDITLVVSTVMEIITDLFDLGRYDILTETVTGLRQLEIDNTSFLEADKRNRAELVKIKRKIEEEGKLLKSILDELIEEETQTEDKLQDTYLYSKTELRYTEDWGRSRVSQNSRRLEQAEAVHSHDIAVYGLKKEQEDRVHAEIQAYITEDAEDMKHAIEQWMNRYEEEIEKKDHELQVKKCRWEDLNNAHVKLQELHEEHRQFIVDRKAELKERKRQARIFKRQTKAAIKIQAWWRGYLVRRMKGPYKWLKKFKRQMKLVLAERAAAGLAGLRKKK